MGVIMAKARVLLIDDHPLLRQGLSQLINQEDDLILCGEAEDADSAMEAVNRLAPDLVILDLILKDRSGTDLLKQLARSHPRLLIIVYSMHDESLHAERALQAGARGYVMKHEPPEQVLHAIRRVLAGEIHLSEEMSGRVLYRLVGATKGAHSVADLSDRELQIFTMIGQGLSSRNIAETLSVSIKTVETHRERIKQKLGLKSGAALTRFAVEWTMKQR
jgi:DNA-binding NarL/FixJ family response regulator